jgi:hypothetical protein
MPKGARAGQSKGAQARMSVCMPNRGGTCPRERAQAKRRARAPNRGRTCPRECTHVVFHAKFGVSKGSARGTNLWGGARSSPRGCAHANRRERMPKGARTSQAEGAQARMSACMPNGGRTCPRERAQAKRRARVRNGWHTCRFACKFRGFQRERARVEQRAHVPKVARVGRMGGDQAQVGARMPI